MSRLYRLLVLSALLLMVFTTPAYAQPLVQCGDNIAITIEGNNICYSGECTVCDTQILAMQILRFLVTFSVIVAALLFVNAGVLYVMAPANPGNVSRAHKIFTNTLMGLIIILVAYLLIDTVMRSLYAAPDTAWGPWNEFLCNGDNETRKYCVPKFETANIGTAPTASPPPPGTAPPGTGTGRGSGVQCAAGNTACSVAALTALGYTPKQANIMSCIAMTESSGIASTPPYNQTHPGSNSSACGTFQVVRTTWRSAARSISGCESFTMCTNATCNAKVALRLVQGSQYSSWLCPNCNSKAMGCVRKFGG